MYASLRRVVDCIQKRHLKKARKTMKHLKCIAMKRSNPSGARFELSINNECSFHLHTLDNQRWHMIQKVTIPWALVNSLNSSETSFVISTAVTG